MTYYLIDTENVSGHYNQIVPKLKQGDQLVLFYSDGNDNLSVPFQILGRVTAAGANIQAIRCESGHNALDFQLSSWLGFTIGQNKIAENGADDKYVIYSNDKGFNALLPFWASRSVNVTQAKPADPSDNLADDIIETTAAAVYSGNEPTSGASTAPPSNRMPGSQCKSVYVKAFKAAGFSGTDADKLSNVVLHTIKLPAKGRSLQIKNQITQVFGRKHGNDIYVLAKPNIATIIANGPFPE